MPHPKGDIVVNLVRGKDGLSAKIALPPGLTGSFVWQGRSTALVAGEQSLTFP